MRGCGRSKQKTASHHYHARKKRCIRKKRLESDREQLKEKSPGEVNSRKTLFAESLTVSDSSDEESGIADIETFNTDTDD